MYNKSKRLVESNFNYKWNVCFSLVCLFVARIKTGINKKDGITGDIILLHMRKEHESIR